MRGDAVTTCMHRPYTRARTLGRTGVRRRCSYYAVLQRLAAGASRAASRWPRRRISHCFKQTG
eukprot:6196306-Pleurochrysis_carterae.AAC.1